ncbi:MAG: tripartite tricarboxylate transporter permease [Deltaproteobacteria bacterium]|nr:tripartite tricarboxylate transporter permease [Deltaproteobacteria bacterium]MBW2307244.1 tripartite tricarboxylate transporter permease [Deltaproteobacteria bacterium]
MLQHMLLGLHYVIHPDILFIIVFGVILGIIVGAIPGLTATMAVALAIPITFGMEAMNGLGLLISIYVGGLTGGLISAILLRIPGTPASIATTFDGYPMAQKGEPGKALGYGVFASFLGGGFSYICLLTIAPAVANLALKLSYFEFFSIIICAMVMIADASEKSLIKALISGFLGMLIATVGVAPVDAAFRFTFGWDQLNAGFALPSMLIGLFAVSQVLNDVENIGKKIPDFLVNYRNIIPKWGDLKESIGNLLRSSLIGTGIGLIPGVGAVTAGLVAYNQAKNASEHPEKFGTGIKEGIIASEAANNAVSGGAMIPLLTLGIPGSPVAALLLSGLIIKDLLPGPALFTSNPGIVYGFFFAFILANIAMFLLMLVFIKPFAMVLKIPKHLLIPPILAMCVIGAYVSNNRMIDVWVLFGFGILGYLMEKGGYPLGPMVLGIILGPIAEVQIRRGLTASAGSFMPLITRPVSLIFLIIALFVLIYPFYQNWKKRKKIDAQEQKEEI